MIQNKILQLRKMQGRRMQGMKRRKKIVPILKHMRVSEISLIIQKLSSEE